MNTQETIHAAVKAMAESTKDLPANNDAAFTIVSVDNRTQLAVAGRPEDIIVTLAEAMLNEPSIEEFIIEALSLAALKRVVDDGEPCNCEGCKASRAAANKVRPDVN